ncbi:hypothetical protein WL19_15750 [Burkholderia ubonensis]|nr:hypothetical protein WL19_15750 [Burkholderia ubonensis]
MAYHAILVGLLIVLASTFEAAGSAWRTAAQHGDPVAYAGREWVRALFGHRDALFVLEHGNRRGCALIGFGFLQVGYAVILSGRDRPIEPFVAWQWAFFVLGTAGLSYGVGSVMYPGTGAPMGVIVAVYVLVPLMWHQQVGRAALVVLQWITVAVGVAIWLLLEGMWKLYHAPRVHGPAASGADPGPLTCERPRPARCCA